MKKRIICIMLAFVTSGVIYAQELTVHYRATYNIQSPDLFAEAGLDEELRSNLAKAYKDVVMVYRLTYRDGESDFRAIPPKDKQEIVFMGQKINPFVEMEKGQQNYTYKNHGDSLMLTKTSFLGKDFVIKDRMLPDTYDIIVGEEKVILGFECWKAVTRDGKRTIWFTPHIPIANEPFVCGVSGLVLEYDDGQQLYAAMEILDAVTADIVRPDESRAISAEAFREMVQKRTERMQR